MEEAFTETRPMIPVTEIIDRQESRIGHLGRDGAIALPRAVRATVLTAMVLGFLLGALLGSLTPAGWFWGALLGVASGWVLIGWSPDEISPNVPKWLLRRVLAKRNRIVLPCLGARTRPDYPVPKGGRCTKCDKDQPLDEDGLIMSCGLKARVYIGLAPLTEIRTGIPIEFGAGLQDDLGDRGDLQDFTSRELH